MEGDGKERKQGAPELCHTPFALIGNDLLGTCARAVHAYEPYCDWFPLWGSVALRLSRKIRRLLTEGSRVYCVPSGEGSILANGT